MATAKEELDFFIKDLSEEFRKEILKIVEIQNPKNRSEMINILMNFRKEKKFVKIGKFTKNYWLQRGWSEKESDIKRKENKINNQPYGSPMQKKYWMNFKNPKTGNNYTEEEAIYKIKSQRKFNAEYWIERGKSEKEAKICVQDLQRKNSQKMIKNISDNPEKYSSRTWTQYKYWMEKHNLSKEEAKNKVSELQNTINLSKLMEKYGDFEGRKKYDIICRNLGRSHTIEGYIERYGDDIGPTEYIKTLEKKAKGTPTSIESIKFFIPLYKKIRKYIDREDIFWGISGSNEYFLWDSENHKIFFYDFTILSKKIIIEYHGKRWHPNPSWDNEKWNKWELFGMSSNEKRSLDLYKNHIAEKKGFTVIEIFSDEIEKFDMNQILQKIQSSI
jgi:hypothetical protein